MSPTTFYVLAGGLYGAVTSRAKTKRVQNGVKFALIAGAAVALATKAGINLPVPKRLTA